jgi:hypothetical protein
LESWTWGWYVTQDRDWGEGRLTTVLTRMREIADKEGFDILNISHKKKT